MPNTLIGPSSRTRKHQKIYQNYLREHPQTNACSFCTLATDSRNKIIKETKHCFVIKNRFAYNTWDDCAVNEHLMITPKRHIVSLHELTSDEKDEYFSLVCEYEANGYSLYARAASNITKSIAHQHTHFIKLAPTRHKFLFYLRSPHLLFFK
ncbi:hypothetical protein FJZ39_01410 [Candidatus Saccharibacteria bacterium]|nr:hypothetical protein [Candidatus Saccharibacteria bacterium]